MSQEINIRERRFNGADYDTLHPETNINMVLDSSNNSVGDVNGALYGDGNGNIVGATISNPNLLDNPWFTINQRGVVTTSANGAFISDRWHIYHGTGVVNADKTITFTATQSGAAIYQVFPYRSDIVGKTVTLSLLKTNGDIQSGQVVIPASDSVKVAFGDGDLFIDTRNNKLQFSKYVVNGQTVNIRACKLELGSVSTLANDVAPDYTTELLKCQRYFVRLSFGQLSVFAFGQTRPNKMYFVITLPTQMRVRPTLSTSGAFAVYENGSDYVVSSMERDSGEFNYIIPIYVTATGLTNGVGLIYASTAAYIDFSAEL